MGVIVLLTCWTIAAIFVGRLVGRYRNPRNANVVILAAVFLSWLFPFSITFLLPIDVSSTRYEQCLAAGNSLAGGAEQLRRCHQSWMYVAASVRHMSWLFVYWCTFVLSWLVVPLLQGYVVAGEFDWLGKIWYSLRLNLLFYAVGLVTIGIMAVYLRIATTLNTWQAVMAFLMALSNGIGLLAVMFFLGHGLVRIPRRLWHSTDATRQLRKLEGRALQVKEGLNDAQSDLTRLSKEIQTLPFRARNRPDLQPFVDELMCAAPIPTSDEELGPDIEYEALDPRHQTGNSHERLRKQLPAQDQLSLEYLQALNYQTKEVIGRRDRKDWEWRVLLQQAWYWQDVKSNQMAGNVSGWKSSVHPPIKSPFKGKMLWLWHVHLRTITYRMLAIFSGLLSVMVFWSEVTLPVSGTDLSLIRPLIGVGMGTVETLSAALLLYLAFCTYSSFLKLRILSFFHLVPGQHTDDKSLLFFAAYITRLTFPLGYNYVNLVDRALHTEFARVMGSMDLVPLLGRYFNLYVPLSLTLICLVVLLRLHHKRIGSSSDDPDSPTHGDLLDGRDLIAQARRVEERELNSRLRHYSSNLSSWRLSGLQPSSDLSSNPRKRSLSRSSNSAHSRGSASSSSLSSFFLSHNGVSRTPSPRARPSTNGQ